MERSAIHWAIINNNAEIVSLLLEARCDIEAADKFGMRPILMAAMKGSTAIARMLIEAGCELNVVNKVGLGVWTPSQMMLPCCGHM